MTKGAVKWFDPERGFGFILSEDGEDVFFHQSSVQGGDYVVLDQGDRVEFELAEGEKGKTKATNVYRTD
jgi:CspA family cold shock protein